MRRTAWIELVVLASVVILVDSGFAQKQDAEGNQLIEAPFVSSPPTIDGTISPGEWDAAESNTVDFVNLGVSGDGSDTSDGPEDISYTFYVMYDDDYLYIAVDVKDDIYISTNYGQRLQWDLPVTWENDAVEYFFDGDLSRTETTNRNETETETGGQWIFGIEADDSPLPFVTPELYGNKIRPYGNTADADWYAQTAVDQTSADWSQEARFALRIVGDPQPGGKIGFNIAVDDVDTYDESTLQPDAYVELRDIQLFWTAFLYDPGMNVVEANHESEWLWGTLEFLERTIVKEWPVY